MIAGLEMPTEGRIMIGDRDVTTVKPADRDIAMVFQSYALYQDMALYENIAFPMRARRRRAPEEVVDRSPHARPGARPLSAGNLGRPETTRGAGPGHGADSDSLLAR